MTGQVQAMILAATLIPGMSKAQLTPPSPVESPRAAAIQDLGLPSIPGRLPTFYSHHAVRRARYLQHLLGGELEYISAALHVRFAPITMVVLDEQQWPRIAGRDPYGMPSVDGSHPAVFVMPARWESVTWMPFPQRDRVPTTVLAQAMAGGKTWEQIKFEGCDGIGAHEIGHTIVYQLRINAQTHWLNEFLASYVGYAYLKAKHPDQVLSNEIFWAQGLNAPHPYTKLSDLEVKYQQIMQTLPANYGWYQVALDQRVIEVFKDHGIDFLRTIRTAFPQNGPTLSSDQVLDKLEGLTGGWKTWSILLEAGTIQASLQVQQK